MMDEDNILAAAVIAAAVIAFCWITGVTSYASLTDWYQANGIGPILTIVLTMAIALISIYIGEDGKWLIVPLSVLDVFVTFSAILE